MIRKLLVIENAGQDVVVLRKINEIIDYLSDKEETDKTWLKKILLKDKPNYEEASKGGCLNCGIDYPKYHTKECVNGHNHCFFNNPPQQEESRGESKCPYLNDDCPRCYPNPQLKEKSTKEDEWEHFNNNFLPLADGKFGESVKDYIKANFVSKVKIKRELLEENIDEPETTTQLAVNNALYRVRKSLGLEEL